MKLFLALSIVFFSGISLSQEPSAIYYDTLFYKEGIVKPCTITKKEEKKIYFTASTKKEIVYKSSVSLNALEYYVDYDSTGQNLITGQESLEFTKDTTKIEYKMITDTFMVFQHHISVNPLALGLLGLDIDYMFRMKEHPLVAVNIPFRLTTFFGKSFGTSIGAGINFIPYNTNRINLYFGGGVNYYLIEDSEIIGFPIKIGLIGRVSPKLTLHGIAGAAPYIGNFDGFSSNVIPHFHFGLGYLFGQKLMVTTTNKQKVWKNPK